MKEIPLTRGEKSNLQKELKVSKAYRKKQFKNLFFSIIIGNSIAGIVVFLNNGNGKLFLGISAVIICMLIPIGIIFILSRKRFKRLTSDLEKGKKIEGKSTIKSINIFNREINLSNGIKVFEPIEFYKTFKKGDLIKFKISPSNEYIFECNKE